MKRFYFLSVLCLIILSVISCQEEKPKPSQKALPQEPGTTIFLDTSMSMRGYFRVTPNAGTTIQRFMLADLLGILSKDNLTPVYLSLFGSTIPVSEGIQSLRRWSFFDSRQRVEDTYSQTETNLIGVFENKEFGRNTIAIIITDGIQSSIGGSQIIEGFDKRIFKVIEDKSRSGTYFWLIGVKSEFNGVIYPERPNDTGKRPTFPYNGLRPIYIWVASHDADIGRNLTGKIVEGIYSLTQPENVKVAALTSHQYPHVDIQIDTELSSSPIKSKQVDEGSFKWLVAKTRDSQIDIPVNKNISEDTTQFSSYDIKWDIVLELEPREVRWAKLIKEDGDWTLRLFYESLPSLLRAGDLKLNAFAIPEISADPWWRGWSTRDDSNPQNGGKTLYLEELDPIIRTSLSKKYQAGNILISVRTP